MILEPHLIEGITREKITQVRVLERPSYQLRRRQPVRGVRIKTLEDGTEQRRVGKPICHVRVSAIENQTIGEATGYDVLAEGFPSRLQLLTHWSERLGRPTPEVLEKIETWVIRFELDREEAVEYLAQRSGYTQDRNASIDPEAPVPPRWFLQRLAEEARARHSSAVRSDVEGILLGE